MSEEMNKTRRELHSVQSTLNYHLEVYGDEIAEREGYRAHDGLEAVHFFLVNKFGWLPRDVRTMSMDDLRFLMAEELADWRLPADAMGK